SCEPLTHYLDFGAAEGRQASPYIDPEWYRTQVAGECKDTLTHWLAKGADLGLSPHPLIDLDFVAREHAPGASARAALDALAQNGQTWKPHPLFDPQFYLNANPDVAASGFEPLFHYLETGWREGRAPHPMFDPAWYARACPEAAER